MQYILAKMLVPECYLDTEAVHISRPVKQSSWVTAWDGMTVYEVTTYKY
jgi:hypothetical protein